eukprot:1999398-Karenia_brevis.AAC.1
MPKRSVERIREACGPQHCRRQAASFGDDQGRMAQGGTREVRGRAEGGLKVGPGRAQGAPASPREG